MNLRKIIFLLACCSVFAGGKSQDLLHVYGQVRDKNNHPVEKASVEILNSNYTAITDQKGNFLLIIPYKQHISLLSYKTGYEKKVKELQAEKNRDSLFTIISLKEKVIMLDSVTVRAAPRPDTLVGSGKFSIYDFDFYEDKFILLTAPDNLDKAELKLADYDGKIWHTLALPKEAGPAKELYHDYLGYTNVICENAIYRIFPYNDRLLIFSISPEDFTALVKPVIDTLKGKLIFSDYHKEYPLFNYYSYNESEKSKKLITVSNEDLLKIYNMEYYYLKPRQRLDAIELAEQYKTDKHVVAALMSGFTKSMYYEPLYAPLFILKDTICVFDHYKDMLFHFDHQGKKLDSIAISYNHPKTGVNGKG